MTRCVWLVLMLAVATPTFAADLTLAAPRRSLAEQASLALARQPLEATAQPEAVRAAPETDVLFRISMVAAVAGHGADLGITENCLGAGRCREMNPWLARYDNAAVFGAAKMTVAGLALWATSKLHDTHPTLATIFNFAQAGAYVAIAARNTRISAPK
jgi:hypothetical protein